MHDPAIYGGRLPKLGFQAAIWIGDWIGPVDRSISDCPRHLVSAACCGHSSYGGEHTAAHDAVRNAIYYIVRDAGRAVVREKMVPIA